jgi:two-component system NarL family sensor kinase
MARDDDELLHPARFRRPILVAGLVAMGTWWGLGLPYSLFAWLLDAQQLRWVLICYAWEVPAAGALGPVLFPQRWWRGIERRWDAIFQSGAAAAEDAAALERTILDYPMRVAFVLLVTSLVGYGVGALQLRWFAQLPATEVLKICLLGLVTGLVGALFSFLYLEWLLAPLLRRMGGRATAPPAGRRVPLYAKVFACSLILTVTALLLLGTIFYSRGERILEEQIGARILAETRGLAADLEEEGTHANDAPWWNERQTRMQLGPFGETQLVDDTGVVVAGGAGDRNLVAEGLRPAVVQSVLAGSAGHLVDRVYEPRIIAFARVGAGPLRAVTLVHRRDFAGELDAMLRRGEVVFVTTLLLALIQGLLFSRRLTRPIEVLTEMATTIARAPGSTWDTAPVPVRTNDEVGELATAFNRMTARLAEARRALERHSADLERRVAEATRSIATLYDVARTTTSTLEIEHVLPLVAEKALAAIGLERLVVLWYPPDVGDVVDAYATSRGGPGVRLDIAQPLDLQTLSPRGAKPQVVGMAAVQSTLPSAVAAALASRELLCLPLVFKDRLLGVILAGLGEDASIPDLELAAALASQAAAALANAALFETARRHETELRKLAQMRVQLQEESLRSLSRELHDGIGQVLTAIKMDLGMIERAAALDAPALQLRVGEVREQVTELVQEVRTMSQLLRPSMLDDFGLVPTLQWFVEKFTARTGIEVALQTPTTETRLPSAIEVLLYRVTQEALTNVMKHARARHVDVELQTSDGEVVLTIADDGIGFDVERFRRTPALGGVGLLGMRERVAYYHGHIEIQSRPQAGVRISLRIPLAAAAGGEGQRGRVPLAG